MTKQKKTAAKASNTTATIDQAEPVTFTDDGQAVTIRVGGKAYENLAKIASAMNTLTWADENSPASVLEYWVGELIRRTAETPETSAGENVTDLVADLVESIDTGADDGTPDGDSKRAELKAALRSISF